METVIEDRFFEEDVPKIVHKIEEDKPGHELLTDKQRKNYKKNIEEFLKKKFKDGAQHTKHNLKNIRGMGKSTFIIKTNQTKPEFFFLSELDEIWYASISTRFLTACKIWGQSEVIWGQRPKFRASIICRVY